MYFGAVSSELAKRIYDETGVNVENYNVSINSNEVRKIILNSHGDTNTETLRGQRPIIKDDIMSIPEIISNFDKVILSKNLYEGKPTLQFFKTINGKTTVVAWSSKKHFDLGVQTMYSGINKGSLASATNGQSPNVSTSETTSGTATYNDTISRSDTDVKQKFSLSDPLEAADYDKPITVADVETLRSIGRKSINDFTSEDIARSEKWAHKFYKELGTKSPFFRAWFGDWRVYDTAEYEPVDIRLNTVYKAGKEVNNDTGKVISWGNTLLSETKNHAKRSNVAPGMLGNISDIIKNAVLSDTTISIPTSNKKMANTAFMHTFYSAATVDGNIWIMRLFAEEALPNKGGDSFTRAYELKEIEKIGEIAEGVHLDKESLTQAKPPISLHNISDLYGFVKQYDPNFNPVAVSPALLNSDGTPKVVYHGTNADFADNLEKVFNYIADENADAAQAMDVLSSVAKTVIEQSSELDMSLSEQFSNELDAIGSTTFYISPSLKNDLDAAYGSYKDFVNSVKGRIRTTQNPANGTSADTVWSELTDLAPGIFDEETYSPLDMMIKLSQPSTTRPKSNCL